jgi:hypothetical protein
MAVLEMDTWFSQERQESFLMKKYGQGRCRDAHALVREQVLLVPSESLPYLPDPILNKPGLRRAQGSKT